MNITNTLKPKPWFSRWLFLWLLAIALAYVESAVVVYLREIFYPDGFTFPITDFNVHPRWKVLFVVELIREMATLVILATGAYLTAASWSSRSAHFLTLFGVWDIFYYVWLKLLIDWPATLFDWDVLFLIPITWAGPVMAPILISLIMVIFAGLILYREGSEKPLAISKGSSLAFIGLSLVLVGQFCYTGLAITNVDYRDEFSWPFFLAGVSLVIILFIRCYRGKTHSD
jgi:hypothetical protein